MLLIFILWLSFPIFAEKEFKKSKFCGDPVANQAPFTRNPRVNIPKSGPVRYSMVFADARKYEPHKTYKHPYRLYRVDVTKQSPTISVHSEARDPHSVYLHTTQDDFVILTHRGGTEVYNSDLKCLARLNDEFARPTGGLLNRVEIFSDGRVMSWGKRELVVWDPKKQVSDQAKDLLTEFSYLAQRYEDKLETATPANILFAGVLRNGLIVVNEAYLTPEFKVKHLLWFLSREGKVVTSLDFTPRMEELGLQVTNPDTRTWPRIGAAFLEGKNLDVILAQPLKLEEYPLVMDVRIVGRETWKIIQ